MGFPSAVSENSCDQTVQYIPKLSHDLSLLVIWASSERNPQASTPSRWLTSPSELGLCVFPVLVTDINVFPELAERVRSFPVL